MTSYSVMPTGPRATVIATWTGAEWCDHSTKITTIPDYTEATLLASVLTRLSEAAWNAAAWLDTAPVIENGIAALIGQLRGSAGNIEPVDLIDGTCRHADESSHGEAKYVLGTQFLSSANRLTRAQRLTIADELATDAASRTEALEILPTGCNPDSESSRAWQMCEVTRCFHNGQVGGLPEAGASWIIRGWDTDRSPAERWGARDQLVRLEQLAAACIAHGGRAKLEDDADILAHLVIPLDNKKPHPSDIYQVCVTTKDQMPWDLDPFAPLTVKHWRSGEGTTTVLGQLEPGDDEGFSRLLGDWTRLVPTPAHMGMLDPE